MLPASMLKAPVCPTPIGCFTDNVEERFFILLIPPAITPEVFSKVTPALREPRSRATTIA
ncbi:MAG: hypothetical protein ACI8QF_000849 [Limisphaerales bacterium]|jgi:hypothetical protein